MRYWYFILLPLLFLTCSNEEPGLFGSNVSTARLAIYGFDVNVEFIEGQDNFAEFTASDSTIILQLTRTFDPDIGSTGDESFQTIYIVIPDDQDMIDISGGDWDSIKSFAFTNEETVNAPVGRVTGGNITGQRLSIDNSWIIQGEVELSENFGDGFPTDLSGTFSSR